jgi:serine/threonine-protein kinase
MLYKQGMTAPGDADSPTVTSADLPAAPITTDETSTVGGGFSSADSQVVALPGGVGLRLGGTDRYGAGKLLGRGGMGEVRLYRDARIGREVAIKTLRSQVGEGTIGWQRFVREARVQGQLEHPAIVPVYDLGTEEGGGVYFSMRRVRGQSLRDVLQRLRQGEAEAVGRWSRRKLLTSFVQVCLAVSYAHSRGVIHRDLKPANIMLGEFGEVQVIDWGLARVLGEAPASDALALSFRPLDSDGDDLTINGAVMGTPAYMPPEQFLGDLAAIGPGTDVYALGMTLYEILALAPFHRQKSIDEIRAAVLDGVALVPALTAIGAPPALVEICVRATAPAAERLPAARELADAVEVFLDHESDQTRRRQLAEEHTRRALAALAVTGEQATEEHTRRAMQEALQAIALDPTQRPAREAFVRLLTEDSDRPSPAVDAALSARLHGARRTGLWSSVFAWVVWFLTIPVVFSLGLRIGWIIAAGGALCVLGTMHAFWLMRRPAIGGWHAALLGLMFALFGGLLGTWLGPFVVVPTMAEGLLMFAMAYSQKRERIPIVLLALLVVCLPFGLEAAGLVPPSHRFVPEGLLLLPRVVDLTRGPTIAALLWSNLLFIAMPAVLLARMRDALSQAERRLALHALRLRRLSEDESPGPSP